MCGIAGIITLNTQDVKSGDLILMSDKIAHRGPDDEGVWVSEDHKVGFAHRRLSIIDLSKGGHQPMVFMNKYTITYNGEVYNFAEERKKLEKTGYKFRSRTDTEVLLALYDKYGIHMLKHLRGMFAFAIYDKQRNVIFLARDRLGKKPLKYYFEGGQFIFSSELKAILTLNFVKTAPNLFSINDYFTYGYIPDTETGFQNIYKLRPGHFMLLNINTRKLTTTRYWKPEFNNKISATKDEWCKSILSKLDESVKFRLVSDVPVGALLSGGVDSSAVVAFMAKHSSKSIKTFTISFPDKRYDETRYARKISKLFNTDHTEIPAKPASIEILPELIYNYEEPFADSSNIVTHLVCSEASKFVKVILNGDGGDENFAGYDRFFRLKRDSIIDKYLNIPNRLLFNLGKSIRCKNPKYRQIMNFLRKSRMPLSSRYVSYNSYFLNSDKVDLFTDTFNAQTSIYNSLNWYEQLFQESNANDRKDAALYADLVSYLPNDLLAKIDIASMSASIEARSPLLDQEFVELACSIPFDLKIKGFSISKHIFKKSLEGIIPDNNLYRPKMGFSIPLSSWFESDLKNYAKDLLLSKSCHLAKIVKQERIKDMLTAHSEQMDFGPKLWSLMSLELWFKTFFPSFS